VSKLKAIIDSAKRAGVDKSQPPRQMPDEAARQGIRAFHGSPHDFPPVRELEMPDGAVVYQHMDDAVPEGAQVIAEHPLGRFDMSKLGTGEGAQAYGQGLYFAESEDLARGYRDQLTKPRVQRAQRLLSNSGNDVDLAIENAKKEIDRLKSLDLTPETGSSKRESLISLQEEKIAELTKLKNTGQMSKGSMYEVNIDATPDDFLDYDKPLSEQSDRVKEALGIKGQQNKLLALQAKSNELQALYDKALSNVPSNQSFDDLFGDSAALRSEGELLTEKNRIDEEIKLLTTPKDFQLGDRKIPIRVQDYFSGANLIQGQGAASEISKQLLDKGIKGIKYLDQGSRAAGKGTSNYVVFDDKLISIAKKYGISIPLASAVIAGTVTPEEAQAVGFGSVVKKSLSDKTDEIQQGIGSLPAGDEMVTGGDLQFLMNIRPGSLRAQQDMGAFPMPSLAVVRQDQPFDSFGEITLVGDPASFDPKRLKANVVFNADAYTVRAPRPFRIAQKDAGLQFKNRFEPVAKEFQEGRVSDLTYELGNMELKKRATAQGFADIQRFFESDLIADVVFLREKGITDIPTTEGAGGNIFLERASLQDLIEPYADERRAWGRKELNKLFKEEEFFDASTNRDYYTGKGLKLKPYTAEEVLKFMKKSRGSAQEGGMATPGALRASLTEKLSSLKDIRAQSGKLVGSDEFKNFQNSSYERISDLAESLRPFYKFDSSSFGYSNEVIEMLIESQKRGLDRTLSEFGFEDVPDYALQEIQEVKSYFRNAPTEYFEAKPERLVDIEEFEGAIVPEGTSDDIIQALKDSGIKIETYADDAQRLNARKKFGGTAFSVAGGITLVGLVPPEESYAAGPSSFIKMNKVVKDQRIKQAKDAGFDTDTVYYHGSDSDIEEFRMPSRDTGQTKTVGTGVFMSSSPDVASSYAKSIDGAAVYPVYINKKEFLKIRPELEGNSWASISTDGLVVEFPDGSTKPATEVFDLDSASTDTDELSRLARSQGHKGLIIEGIVDTGYGGAGEYRYATKYLQEKGYDVSLPIGSTKEAYDKISAVPSEVMNAARLYAQEKLLSPADVVVSFEPKNIRSINAEFDPEKKDSPQILASAPFAAGVAGLGAASLLAPDQAEAGGLGSLPAATKKARAESVKQAKEQGYDLKNVMYHASKQDIKEFVPGYSDGLVFLTPSKEFANNWLGKGKFQERQGGTGAIEGVRAEKKRWREEADKILKSLPEDQRQQYYEEILNPQRQQLLKDERLADSAIYPVVTRTKKPFVPSKNVDVLEELYSKEYLDAPFGSGFPTYRDALKDGNYLLYEKKEVVDFLKSKGYDSMFLKESSGADEPFTTLAVFEPNNIRSVNAKFDPKKKDSPQILASAPFAAGAAGLGTAAMLSPEQAQAQTLNASGFNLQYPIKPKKESPGVASLAGQLGLGAMSEIGGAILGGAAGVGEYLRGSRSPIPATAQSIRDANEGVSDFVGGLYDAGPEAQAVGQEIMQGIGETIAPIAEYAMEGPIMDERGLNMLPLIAQKLGIPAYQLAEMLFNKLPEREQEAAISASDAFL
jgi:hypothetical protein